MAVDQAALEPVLTLALLEGIGPGRLATLVGRFGSAEGVLRASARELELLPTIGPQVARRIVRAGRAETDAARQAIRTLRRVGASVLTPDQPGYPDAFRLIHDPPFLLFTSGDLTLLDDPAIAVVGTRNPTEYGRSSARELSGALASAGYCVVSGMARGIDSVAHAAALRQGGATIGVLGNGIEQIYPPENRALFAAVRDRGLLITEFLPGETPRAGNFPRRNRLIVALGAAVLVVEMGLKSGAQHTVTYALEQGRDVLAVPGPIGSPSSEGTNQLIKDGARLVTGVQDILEELEGVGTKRPAPPGSPVTAGPTHAAISNAAVSQAAVARANVARADAPQPDLPLLSPLGSRAFAALGGQPSHVDELCARTSLLPGAMLGALLELELKGLARALPGKLYELV
jgi:DNA processing protein